MSLGPVARLVKGFVASPLGWGAAAPLRPRGVNVLTYHRINRGALPFEGLPVERFEEQMKWIRRHCTPTWPEDLFDAARRADRRRPPILVTFDDGYRDYHDVAYPILRDLDIPAVVFITTDMMDRGGVLWTERLTWAIATTRRESVRAPWEASLELPLGDASQRRALGNRIKEHLKDVPDAQRIAWLDDAFERFDTEDPAAVHGRQMLSWDEVRATLPGTRYGGHSHTHPILSRVDAGKMELEIAVCGERISAETGQRPRLFAYPNGRAQDFNDLTRELLRKHGFEVAFSTIPGINGPEADALAIKRRYTGGLTAADLAFAMMRS